jgi:hypothetical protein
LHSIISTYGKITISYISTIIKFCSWKKLYIKKAEDKNTQRISPELHKVTSWTSHQI